MTEKELEQELSLSNDKYKIESQVDVFKLIDDNNFRTIQLPSIAKLTTDNQSIIKDFPIKKGSIGANPYDRYCIKVADTEGTTLYILVLQDDEFALLCPIIVGNGNSYLTNTTANWRIRELEQGESTTFAFGGNFQGLTPISSVKKKKYVSYAATDEYGQKDIVAIKVETKMGVFNKVPVLLTTPEKGLFDAWYESEDLSLHDAKHGATAPSLVALVLQIWLHTIAMWRERCLNRKIVIKNDVSDTTQTINSIKEYNCRSRQHIIDLNKDIVIYENHSKNTRKFNGYHMTETQRCGHFRHLKDGKVIYIKPTTVHFKQILPDTSNHLKSKLIYRNTEDFLREKSYLEFEICEYLKLNGIKYEREKCFSWLGRKRLDFYLPDYKIAIECQGVQHFYKYGAEDTDLENRQQRDKDKFNECKENGVQLFYYKNEEIPLPKDIENKELYFNEMKLLFEIIKTKKGN